MPLDTTWKRALVVSVRLFDMHQSEVSHFDGVLHDFFGREFLDPAQVVFIFLRRLPLSIRGQSLRIAAFEFHQQPLQSSGVLSPVARLANKPLICHVNKLPPRKRDESQAELTNPIIFGVQDMQIENVAVGVRGVDGAREP